MLPTIIVLNRNFAPLSATGPFKYGVVSYALNAAEALKSKGLLAGFVLYRRDERLNTPRLQPTHSAIELGHCLTAPHPPSRAYVTAAG